MYSQSKSRRTKTPIASVRDKFEEVHKASQSEMPTPVVNRSEPSPTKQVVQSAPVLKPKKNNAWITHVKSIAESKGIKFRDALRDPETKATYKK